MMDGCGRKLKSERRDSLLVLLALPFGGALGGMVSGCRDDDGGDGDSDSDNDSGCR